MLRIQEKLLESGFLYVWVWGAKPKLRLNSDCGDLVLHNRTSLILQAQL